MLETYAFRVENGSRLLAYSGDSAPCPQLVDAARDADLFVCEATLLRGELDGEPRGHLSLDEAVEA
jgi:ribonuclease BN (tRNA processing enzyme)